MKLHLPLHLVGLIALAQAERGGEVACEQVHLLDVRQQRLVDGLLVRGAGAADLLLLQVIFASVIHISSRAMMRGRRASLHHARNQGLVLPWASLPA